MGQKTHPTGFRLSRKKKWVSNWYANKQEFGRLLAEDRMIRQFLLGLPICVGTSKIIIKRTSEKKIEVTIRTARPGLVIGKKGAEIESLKKRLQRLTRQEVWVEVEEIKRPDLDAQLVASAIAKQLERRVPFRRILKKSLQTTMDAGASGVKIQISGRVGGAEIARSEGYKEGRVPLHTLRANIDYASVPAYTAYGIIGVKVWINLGEDILTKKMGG